MTRDMRLSEAIRKGTQLVPTQHRGDYIAYVNGQPAACALGAACLALTGMDPRDAFMNYVLGIHTIRTYYPDIPDAILDEIIDRNDEKREPREDIAAWLESIGL